MDGWMDGWMMLGIYKMVWVTQGSLNGTPFFGGGIKLDGKMLLVILRDLPETLCIVWVGVIFHASDR